MKSKPLIIEIPYHKPNSLFNVFCQQEGSILFDSAYVMPQCGRYSFIAIEPYQILLSKNKELQINNQKFAANPFEVIREALKKYPLESSPVPFPGGAAGFFSYDLFQQIEPIASLQQDDMFFHDVALGFYDVVIGFDHAQKKAWIVGVNHDKHVIEKCQRLKNTVEQNMIGHSKDAHYKKAHAKIDEQHQSRSWLLASNFSQEAYCEAVNKVKNHILAGDIFEANISQRFHAQIPKDFNPYALFKRLRQVNPAPFASYLNLCDTQIISASPERFLSCFNNSVEARPIKGTCARSPEPIIDKQWMTTLMNSEKDRAENIMIVDLMRNDLSRVCTPESVVVSQLCGLESYATVHHLVSVVKGKLQPKYDAIDLLRVCFPGGSITGAPKIRAMEIIAEIEPTVRGPYCGAIGYIDFSGNMDLAMTIRTFAAKNDKIVFQSGGAIVLDSDPLSEYCETLTKAHALKIALNNLEPGVYSADRFYDKEKNIIDR